MTTPNQRATVHLPQIGSLSPGLTSTVACKFPARRMRDAFLPVFGLIGLHVANRPGETAWYGPTERVGAGGDAHITLMASTTRIAVTAPWSPCREPYEGRLEWLALGLKW